MQTKDKTHKTFLLYVEGIVGNKRSHSRTETKHTRARDALRMLSRGDLVVIKDDQHNTVEGNVWHVDRFKHTVTVEIDSVHKEVSAECLCNFTGRKLTL